MADAYAVGQFIFAQWKGKGRDYDAIVVKMNGEGTYEVAYADGDYDRACQGNWMKTRPDAGPAAWKCDECDTSNIPFLKSCQASEEAGGVCGAPNPRYSRAALPSAFGGWAAFRRPKPPKVDANALPNWEDYYTANIAPNKKKVLVKRHPLMKGSWKVDKKLNQKLVIWNGDITALESDAIVNAANEQLWAGGGICGAIHSAAGDKLEEECRRIGPCPTGLTVITAGYELYAKHVLHSVGPTDGDHAKLVSCYQSCLDVAQKNKLKNLVFCCISTGIFGFPNGPACIIALISVRDWLEKNPDVFERVVFCTFTQEDRILYDQLTPIVFPVEDDNVQAEESKGAEPEKEAEPEDEAFEVGDRVLCLDTERINLPAVIEDVKDGKFFIHYLNYSRRWDEWVECDSTRLSKFRSREPPRFVLEPLFPEAK